MVVLSNIVEWYPTSLMDIVNSFKFSSTLLIKKNIAYNIQYLQYLNRNINEEKTTTVLYRIRYKMFIITSMSIIETIFIALLEERNLIPIEEWKDGEHHKEKINEDLIKVTFNRKRVAPHKKKIKFDEAINLIMKNEVLGISKDAEFVIRELQNVRNHLHLDKAKSFAESNYNTFNENIFFATKIVLYLLLKSKKISKDTKYIEFLKPVVEGYVSQL